MYANFATVYDHLMRDVPYAGWVKYLHRLFAKHHIKPNVILDIGCGTGNVTIPLAEMGYSLTGLDLSPDMLAVAEAKARTGNLDITWIQQDMRSMDLGGRRFDMVVSMTDSLNYIESKPQLRKVIKRVRSLLAKGGWFVFDLNTEYKLREVFGNNVFTYLDEEICYIWENAYNRRTGACTMDLTFFTREAGGSYRRFAETHKETGYSVGDVQSMLTDAGFTKVFVYAENTLAKPGDKAERIYFLARRGS